MTYVPRPQDYDPALPAECHINRCDRAATTTVQVNDPITGEQPTLPICDVHAAILGAQDVRGLAIGVKP